MTNDEMKKKIVEILEDGYTPIEYDDGDWGQTYFPTNEDVADALIAAGIGDVKEAEHRAARSERALQIADELGELCGRKEDYVQQAEKELAEEEKNEQRNVNV